MYRYPYRNVLSVNTFQGISIAHFKENNTALLLLNRSINTTLGKQIHLVI